MIFISHIANNVPWAYEVDPTKPTVIYNVKMVVLGRADGEGLIYEDLGVGDVEEALNA